MKFKLLLCCAMLISLNFSATPCAQVCPDSTEYSLQNYIGGGTVACPCFVQGEEAGAVLNAPAEHYPIQILRVGIGWGSYIGGAPQQVEEGIQIYGSQLPNPGASLYALIGPYLTDGAINEFNFEEELGEVVIESGPFTVTLRFVNDNAGDPFAPSVVHDGNGCQIGRNVIYAIPGGWMDACSAGITGDWVIYVVYRRVCPPNGVDEEYVLSNRVPAFLGSAQPNPFSSSTLIDFFLAHDAKLRLDVYDIRGSKVATLADSSFPAGRHSVVWNGESELSGRLAAGVYFVALQVGDFKTVRKAIIVR